MAQRPEITDVARLVRQITAGTYVEMRTDESDPDDLKELTKALNDLAGQRDELITSYNEDLKQSEARLRGIIESTPVGICITDEEGHYEYVNPTYNRLYGFEPEELIGLHFSIVVPPEHRDELVRLHAEFMGHRYELRGEWPVVKKNGETMTIIADAAYIIDVDGRPKKVTFVLDISERKRAEELLRSTVDRLNDEIRHREELEKVKAQVERMIRHDLRNPLNGIMAAAQILMTDEITPEQQELCMIIRESGRKLDTMLSSSMDLIKMEEGTYRLRPDPNDLARVIEEVRREVEPLAANHGVRVVCNVDGRPLTRDLTLPIEGERLYLADAFANLLRNAVEASQRNDQVTVSITTGAEYRVEFHNTQPVPQSVRSVFFDRYATSGKKNGTGLGTYVAALITRVHNGEISFTTSDEDGTRVTVVLPERQDR